MSQNLFASTTPPSTNSLTLLDANFTELYAVRNLLTVSGSFLGLGVTPAVKWHLKDSGSELMRMDTTSGVGAYISCYSGGVLQGLFGWGSTAFNNGGVGIRTSAGVQISFAINSANTNLRIDGSGNVIALLQTSAPTLSTNNEMGFQLVSNTSLKILVRGSDGVTRSTTLTLA